LGLIKLCTDRNGNPIPKYEGYGEAHKLASIIVDAIWGDKVSLATDIPKLREYWDTSNVKLVITDSEERGSELGDIVYHVNKDVKTGEIFTEWVDPSGYFRIGLDIGIFSFSIGDNGISVGVFGQQLDY